MRHRVLLIFVVGFALGICAASTFHVNWAVYLLTALLSLILLCFSNRSLPIVIIVAGLAFGAIRYDAYYPPGWNIESFVNPAPVTMAGKVESDPVIEQHKATFLLRVNVIETRSGAYEANGITSVLVHGAAFASMPALQTGDDVRLSGLLQDAVPATDPGEFDWRTRLVHQGVSGELIVQRPDGAKLVHSSGVIGAWNDWSKKVESFLSTKLNGSLPPDEAGVLTGILFGDRHGLTPELQREFAATGTAHVLATAGLHIGILAICLTWLFRLLPVTRKASALLTILLLSTFAFVAGDRDAVVRAVIAASIFFGGKLFERVPDVSTTIATAALVILLGQPAAIFDSDFQMSFVTVACLALFMPFWDKFYEPLKKAVRKGVLRTLLNGFFELVGLSLIAQLAAMPLTVYYFYQLSLLSLPVNLMVVPLLFVLIPTAVLTVVTMLLAPTIGVFAVKTLLHPMLWTILHIVKAASGCSLCAVAVAQPPAFLIIVIYAAAFTTGMLLRARPRWKLPFPAKQEIA